MRGLKPTKGSDIGVLKFTAKYDQDEDHWSLIEDATGQNQADVCCWGQIGPTLDETTDEDYEVQTDPHMDKRVIVSRELKDEHEAPKNLWRMKKLAEEAGFEVKAGYACSFNWQRNTGKYVDRIVESAWLDGQGNGESFKASWTDGKFDTATRNGAYPYHMNSLDLRDYLKGSITP